MAAKMLPSIPPKYVLAVLVRQYVGSGTTDALWDKQEASKKLKIALETHARALKRVVDTRAALFAAGSPFVKLYFSQGKNKAHETRILNKRANGEDVNDVFDTAIKQELDLAKAWSEERRGSRSKPSQFDAEARFGANAARVLLDMARALLDKADKPAIAARNSDWCRLAAILWGYPNRKNAMYHYVAEAYKQGPKALKTPDWV